MSDKSKELSKYRLEQAKETLGVAKLCYETGHYKDAINRAYYAAFYAVKAVLAIEGVDFKRHKDVVAHFNQNYIATEKYEKEIGRFLARLQKKRESSDYDDFAIASREEAEAQLLAAESIINVICNSLGDDK